MQLTYKRKPTNIELKAINVMIGILRSFERSSRGRLGAEPASAISLDSVKKMEVEKWKRMRLLMLGPRQAVRLAAWKMNCRRESAWSGCVSVTAEAGCY